MNLITVKDGKLTVVEDEDSPETFFRNFVAELKKRGLEIKAVKVIYCG